ALFGAVGRGSLRDEDVSIRQHIDPAWMLQARGERSDLHPIRRHRLAAIGPTLRGRDLDRRNQRLRRLRQRRIGTRRLLDWQRRAFHASGATEERRGQRQADHVSGTHGASYRGGVVPFTPTPASNTIFPPSQPEASSITTVSA